MEVIKITSQFKLSLVIQHFLKFYSFNISEFLIENLGFLTNRDEFF